MITLVLEAATYEGSTALLDGATLLGERAVAMRGREHEALMAAVGELLAAAGLEPRGLQRIVCGAGPGSFTSLRIAGSIAKGLALAIGAPLIPVSSLTLMAASVAPRPDSPRAVLAALDAMRNEYYVQLHELAPDGSVQQLGDVFLVPSDGLLRVAAEHGAELVGPAISGHVMVPRAASARNITKMIDSSTPADLAGWEPGYGRLAEAQVKWEAAHGRPLQA